MAFNRKCVLLLICVASMFKSSVGECKTTLRNLVINEGQPLRLDAGDNENCTWAVAPSDVVFNIRKDMCDDNGVLNQKFSSVYRLEGSSLMMNSAETQPILGPHATSGIYILTCPVSNCTTAAKVVVVKSGPTCSCAYDPDSHSTIFSVTIVYSDTAKNDMYPAITYTLKGVVQKSEMPLPVRIDPFRFSVTSILTSSGRSFGMVADFTGTVEFADPSEWPISQVDQRVPDYTAQCSFDKCT